MLICYIIDIVSLFLFFTRIGNLSENMLGGWHFLALMWHPNGRLNVFLHGGYQTLSQTFAAGHQIERRGHWRLGNETRSFRGEITQLNLWSSLLPLAPIRALSRGNTGIISNCNIPAWSFFMNIISNNPLMQKVDNDALRPRCK